MTDPAGDREAADTSEDEPLEGASDLPDEVRNGDVGETDPSGKPLDDDDDSGGSGDDDG